MQVDLVVVSFVNVKTTEGVRVERGDIRLRGSFRVEGEGDSNNIMVREELASLEREGVTEVVSHAMLGKLKSPARIIACCFTELAFVT